MGNVGVLRQTQFKTRSGEVWDQALLVPRPLFSAAAFRSNLAISNLFPTLLDQPPYITWQNVQLPKNY
jgi:hypothetical protein